MISLGFSNANLLIKLGDGANALFAQLNSPQGIGLLSSGAIIVSDTLNHRIRKIENGIISTIAGTGSPGYTGKYLVCTFLLIFNHPYPKHSKLASGTATSALINTPLGLAVYNNEVYFADSLNHVIRKISSSGSISNEQGVGATSGSQTLPLQMNTPTGVVFQSGTMYMADSKNLRVCYPGFLGIINCISTSSEPIGLGVYSGVVYAALLGNVIVSMQSGTPIVAGTGTSGFSGDGGVATSALLNGPSALTFDSSGNMLISDSSNNRIRKVTNGIISTLAGTSNRNFGNGAVGTLVSLSSPNSVYYAGNDDSTGGILIADMNNHVLRRLKDGRIYNVIGNVGISGSNSGNGVNVNAATLNSPPFVMKRFGDLIYFLDSGGCALRRIESSGVLKLVVGSCNSGNQDYFLSKSFDISSDGIIYIADYYNHRIAKFVIGGTSLTTLAGGSLKGFAGMFI